MKTKYSFTGLGNFFRRNILFAFLLQLAFLLIGSDRLLAEGTKEVVPTATANNVQLQVNRSSTGGFASRFAGWQASDTTDRLFIRINNHSTENVYLGFKEDNNNNNVYFRIKNSAGVIVYAATQIPNSGAGYIGSWTQASIGPNNLSGNSGGYSPLIFDPSSNGDFYIEFNRGNSANSNELFLDYFDITVANGSANSNVKKGRLWSYSWGFNSGGFTPPNTCVGSLFVYSTDSIVTEVDLNGLSPFYFRIFSNSTGVSNTGVLATDRQSKNFGSGDPNERPEYKVFLNNPDLVAFPSATASDRSATFNSFTGCPGNYCFNFTLNGSALTELKLDLNNDGDYLDAVDRTLESNGTTGANCIPWDGKDGTGANVGASTTFKLTLYTKVGTLHIPVYDAEQHTNGYLAQITRPPGIGIMTVYWDDNGVSGGSVNLGGTTALAPVASGTISGHHSWLDPTGNQKVMNTWFTVKKTVISDYTIVLSSFSASLTSQTNVLCRGNNTGAATVTAINGTPPYSYSWNTSPVKTTATATGLVAGTYICTITDSRGCSTTVSATITQPAVSLTSSLVSSTNILCFGGSTGAIDISVAGGTGAYTYSWTKNGSPFAPVTQDLTGLTSGTYMVTVTDANNCTTTRSVTLTQPAAALSASISSQTNVLCFGASTGAVTVAGANGTSPYTYSIDGGAYQGTGVFTGLSAGAKTVTVKDANNCTTTQAVTITQPAAALSSSLVSSTNVLCFGGSTGAIDISVAGGTGAYTYSWTKNGSPFAPVTQDLTGLTSGTYMVTVTDANNCTTTRSVTLTQPAAALSASISSQTNVLCFGASTGAVTVAGANGTSPYTYSIDGGAYQGTGVFTGLSAGAKTVTVKDANNCTTTQAVTITQPASALSASISSQTNVLCFGASTGAVTVAGANGTSPYTYSIDGGAYQGTGVFTGLSAGAKTVTVKDANNCTTTQAVTITQPAAALSSSLVSSTNVLCFGGTTGAIDIGVSGGTGAYTYSWTKNGSPFAPTTQDLTGLTSGAYVVTITDANNCTTTRTVTITQPAAALSSSISSQTNVLCYSNSTGAVTVVGANGTSPYTYSLDGGAYQGSGTFTGLSAGVKTVTVKDANNCTTTQAVTITQPSAGLGSGIISQTNVLCYGNSTGVVTVIGTSGTSPYTYSLDGGAYQGSGAFSGLSAGAKTITVKDANNCTAIRPVTITQPFAALSVSISSQTNVLCYGNSTGAVTVVGANGTSPYTYSIDGGAYQGSGTFAGLSVGAKTVTVKDANNCTTTQAVTITQPAAALSASIGSQTNVLCYGNSTGSVTIVGANGTPIYNYSIDGGGYQSSGTFIGLSAGAKTVTVRDFNNCTTTQAVTITQPSAALASSLVSQTNVLCYGASTGAIDISVSGGTGAYTYSWTKNGSPYAPTTQDLTGLTAAMYVVTITDANNCTTTRSVIITQPSAALSSSIGSQTNVLCYGNSTGAVTVVGANGTSPYTYSLDGGAYQGSGTFAGLSAGAKTVTVKDANNCTTTQAVTITQPAAALSASISSQTNVLCFGASTGAVTVIGANGTSPYTYSIDGGAYQGTGVFTGLSAGVKTVTVKDFNNCTTTQVVTITQPAAALSSSLVSSTNVLCFGGSTGAIDISVSGGTGAYTYSWTKDAWPFAPITQDLTGLSSGVYNVNITDANNCTTSRSVTITQPAAALSSSVSSQTNVLCFGASTGAVTVVGANGTSPYTYSIDGGAYQGTGVFGGLSAGAKTVTVKDANNCTTTRAVTIIQPAAALSASIGSQTNVLCFGNSTGAVTVIGANGTPPLTYSLNGGTYQGSGTFTGLGAGANTITIKDFSNCTTTQAVTITQPAAALSSSLVSSTNILCFGASTGAIDISVAGGTGPYTYGWTKNGSPFAPTSQDLTGLTSGTYVVTITDANNCTTTRSVTLTQPAAALSSSISSQTNVLCFGNSTGVVTVAGANGTSPYTYSIDGGAYQGSGTFSGLSAGAKTVTVKDANNCTTTQAVTITQPAAALSSILVSSTNVLCGGTTGAIDISVTGGTGAYTYSWTKNGSPYAPTTQDLTGLEAGVYFVTITDANNCTTTRSVTITQPASALSASISSQTNVLCFGNSTGAVTVAGANGTSPYTYSIDGGAYQGSGTFSGLSAGAKIVTVKDANNCTTTQAVTITQPAAALSSSISSQTNVLCFGNSTGAVTVAGANGTSPYTYSIDGGAYQGSGTFSGLSSGAKTVTVKDANNCTITQAVTITQPAAALGSSLSSSTNVLCFGGSTGAIDITVTGGTGAYSYVWTKNGSPFAPTTQDLTGLEVGTYFVTITDANNCITTRSVTLTQPASALSVVCSNIGATSYGAGNGSVTVVPSGGSTPYSYLWSNSATTSTVSGLSSGTFSVVVTDNNGCTAGCSTTLDNFPLANHDIINATEDATSTGTVATNDVMSGDGGNTFNNACLTCTTTANGTLTFNSNGTYSYTPNANFNGVDQFIYQLCDVDGDCDTALVTLYIQSVDDAPVANHDVINATEDATSTGTVATNDVMSGDGGNTFNNACLTCTTTANGSLTFNSNGTYSYTPNTNFNGVDQFIYQLCDVDGDCDTALVILNINSVDDAPVANHDIINATEDATSTGTVATNDVMSGDGGNTFNNACLTCTTTANGTLTFNSNGTYSYTPNANFNGVDQFIYQLCDVDGDCDTALVTLYIQSVNDLPVAIKDNANTSENTPITIPVITNDNFGGDGPVNGPITIEDQPSNGTATVNNGGTPNDPTDDQIVYVPFNGFTGQDTLIYKICDQNNDCDTALVIIQISPSSLAANCGLVSNVTCYGAANGSLNVSATGGTSPYTYLWSNGATTNLISGLNPGLYSVAVTDAIGVIRSCNISVSSPSQLLITTNTITNLNCNGSGSGAIDIGVNGGIATYTYGWTKLGGGFTALTQDVSGLSAGTYFVHVIDANGCNAYDTIEISGSSAPLVLLNQKSNLACDDVLSGYIDVNVSGGLSPYTYNWTKTGDIGFSASTQDVYQLGSGIYTLIVTDANGCKDTIEEAINSGNVEALFTATQLDCDGNYQLVNNSIGADDYVWDIKGISPAGLDRSVYCTTSDTTFIYSFVPGTYLITLTANSDEGCVDTMTQTLTITVKPLAVFTYEATPCTNQVNFTNLTVNGVSSTWNFGDPASGLNNVSSLNNPSHTFSTGGTYQVTLISNDGAGCSDTLTRAIPVTPVGSLPVANFNYTIETNSCVTRVHFNNTSTNSTNFVWIFPDGSSNNQVNTTKTFPLAGTYNIQLVAISASGCLDTIDYNIIINTNTYGAVAKFVANDSVQCFAGNKFNFINQSLYYGAGYIANYYWDFGDGDFDNTNTFVYDKSYAAPGVYTVRLIGVSPSGCADTAYQTVRVMPSADASFVMTIGCGKTAYLEHTVDTNVTYVWNFGDGNYASNHLDSFIHIYNNVGLYNITLTTYMENGCSDSYSIGTLASDGRIPVSNFSYYQACGNNIQFNNLSQWGSSFLWNFGDGSPIDSSYEPYHSFPYAGTFNVTLTVYSSPTCIHSVTLPVVAPQGWNIRLPRARMAFDVQPCTNIIQARDSSSIDASNFKWYLNGTYVGSGSTINIPTTTAGIYELWMIADNGYCSDTAIAGIHIQDAPIAGFDVTTNSCSNTIMVSSNSTNANSYEWNFGEPSSPYNTKYGATASHTYSANGTYNVRLIAYNLTGCADTIVIPVTVSHANSMNMANFSYNNGLCNCVCQNLVRFKNLTPGNNVYLWSFGDGSTSVLPNPSKGYPAAGSYTVTLTSVDNTGCMSTKTKTVDVDASVNGPSASFSTDHQVQCVDSNSFNFYNSSTYMGQGWINKYYWYFGDGTLDSTNTFVYNKHYATAGNYIVTLVAVGAEGCRDTMSMYVQVRSMPCTGVLRFVNLQDGSNWNIDPKLGDGGILSSVKNIENGIEYGMFPNPTSGLFTLKFTDLIHEPLTIRIVDIVGKEVYSKEMNKLGIKEMDIELQGVSEGSYMLIIQSDSHQYKEKKFVVIR